MTEHIDNTDELLEIAKAATQADWYPMLVGSLSQREEDEEYIVDSGPTFICSMQVGGNRAMHDANHIAAFDPPTMVRILERLADAEFRLEMLDK